MILDWNPSNSLFFLRVKRGEADIRELMETHGFDLSAPKSSASEAVLFTAEPYAAVTFSSCATEVARKQLQNLLAAVDLSWLPNGVGSYPTPAGQELWPFQVADLDYALSRKYCLIGDEPGLGKTPTAIVYANALEAKKVLVIVPANIRLQWVKRIHEWSTMPWGYHVHVILEGQRGVHPTAEWTVVSYDLARTPAIGKALAKLHFDVMILDEVHYAKTNDSKRTRAIFGGGENRLFSPLLGSADRAIGLTGTPLPNRPREAYTLARAFCWEAIDWMSEDSFKDRFNPSKVCQGVRKDGSLYTYTDERSGRHGELQNRLRANLMVRHLKRDVMPQLKFPAYDLIRVEETQAVKLALQAECMLDIDPERLEGADATALGHIASVRRQMGIAMAPQIAKYVEMLLDGGEDKPVVFAWHIEVLDILQKALARFKPLRIDGSTGAVRKQATVDLFVSDPTRHVLIGNLLSMGTGTDGLQAVSTHALLAEPDWTPGMNQQAVDRLDRGGQKGQVQADFFVAPGSISEKVLASALRKNHVLYQVLDRRVA